MLIGDPNVGMMGSGGSSVNAVHLNGGYGNFVSPAVYGDYTWTDSPTGICSFWFRHGTDNAGIDERIFTSNHMQIYKVGSTGILSVYIENLASNHAYYFKSTSFPSDGTVWHHCAISWDTNHSAGNKLGSLVIDGANVFSLNQDSSSAFDVGWSTGTPKQVGSINSRDGKYDYGFYGDLAEFYLGNGTYLDFTQASNLQKFRTATGHPANLGSNGSAPTGTQPLIYLKDPAATYTNNSGSIGNFTQTSAAITDASSTP